MIKQQTNELNPSFSRGVTMKCFVILASMLSLQAATALILVANPAHAATLDDVNACFNNLVANPAQSGVSGIGAKIFVDEKVVLRAGYGTVSPSSTQPVTPTTRFRIGSTNKMMTATALLSLSDDGRVNLDQPVQKILPGFTVPGQRGWEKRVTPRLAITHQGGFKDSNIIDGPRDDESLRAFWTTPQSTATVPLMVAPGTFWNYANTNFSLAGALVEQAAGVPYRQAMRERVFAPLGMSRAVFTPAEVLADNDYAFGIVGAQLFGPNDYDNAVLRPSGWLWGSVDDVGQFARFLRDGNRRVLSDAAFHTLREPQLNTFELLDREGYGSGVFTTDYVVVDGKFHDGVKVRQHGGNLPGYTASIVTLPELHFGIAVVGNGNALNFAPCVRQAIAATVAERLPAPSPLPDVQIQKERFGDYIGYYTEAVSDPIVGPIEIASDGNGSLAVSLPLLDALSIPYERALRAVSRDNFVIVIQGAGFLLTGFREPYARNRQVRYLRTRLTVGERAGFVATLPIRGKSSIELSTMRTEVLQRLNDASRVEERRVLNFTE